MQNTSIGQHLLQSFPIVERGAYLYLWYIKDVSSCTMAKLLFISSIYQTNDYGEIILKQLMDPKTKPPTSWPPLDQTGAVDLRMQSWLLWLSLCLQVWKAQDSATLHYDKTRAIFYQHAYNLTMHLRTLPASEKEKLFIYLDVFPHNSSIWVTFIVKAFI